MLSMYELLPALKPWEVRLFGYLLIGDGCWAWLGHTHNPDGYPLFTLSAIENGGEPTELRVHRYMYELLVGPIPEGLELDHLCRNVGCANPDHLEIVTRQENMSRKNAHGLCKAGHRLEETRKVWTSGRSCCGVCYEEFKARQKAARHARGLKKPGWPKGRPRFKA